MTKRFITVVITVVAAFGLAAAPAQAKAVPGYSGSAIVQPLGWSWGI